MPLALRPPHGAPMSGTYRFTPNVPTRARRARVGTFGVNLYVPDIGAPWGGRKASGMGSVYGPEGLQTYLATKCVFLPG